MKETRELVVVWFICLVIVLLVLCGHLIQVAHHVDNLEKVVEQQEQTINHWQNNCKTKDDK